MTKTGAATGLERQEAVALYRRMLLIRRLEDTVQSLFQQGQVHGTTHLYSGQEAVAAGVCSVLEGRDRVAGTYRGHGHALALGVEPQALLDELLGRATGVCAGRAQPCAYSAACVQVGACGFGRALRRSSVRSSRSRALLRKI